MKTCLCFATLVIAFIFYACKDRNHDFPDVLNVSKTIDLIRVKGTKYFAKIPEGYMPIENRVRYQKDPDTYFQINEAPNVSFNEFKDSLSANERQWTEGQLTEAVKYNEFNGVYFEKTLNGETIIQFVFGDESFLTTVIGRCLENDKESKEQLKNIFSHSYYDKSYDLNPLELINFKFDSTITGFKYATSVGNVFFFTVDGKADFKNLGNISGYWLMPFPTESFEQLKKAFETINSRVEKVSDVVEKEVVINGNRALETTMYFQSKDTKKWCRGYQVAIYMKASGLGVVFTGNDCDNGIYLKKFRSTVQSIKL